MVRNGSFLLHQAAEHSTFDHAEHGLEVTALYHAVVIRLRQLVVAAAQFYQNPPAGWTLAGWKPTTAVAKSASTVDFTVQEAMRTWQFWLLMAMLFLNSVFERTWSFRAGQRPASEYWQHVIQAVKKSHPNFLFIAEAYWDLEW